MIYELFFIARDVTDGQESLIESCAYSFYPETWCERTCAGLSCYTRGHNLNIDPLLAELVARFPNVAWEVGTRGDTENWEVIHLSEKPDA